MDTKIPTFVKTLTQVYIDSSDTLKSLSYCSSCVYVFCLLDALVTLLSLSLPSPVVCEVCNVLV
jgi:hypothetical protein